MERSTEVSASAVFLISMALALLILPFRWLMAWLIAAMVHEFGHYAAIRLCGGRVRRFFSGYGGAVMEVEGVSGITEALCAVAGPAAGLLLLLTARWMPVLAVCALVQSLYNFLPLYPLDGGRAFRALMPLLFSQETADKLSKTASICCLLAVWAVSIYAAIWLKVGMLPLVAGLMMTRKAKF